MQASTINLRNSPALWVLPVARGLVEGLPVFHKASPKGILQMMAGMKRNYFGVIQHPCNKEHVGNTRNDRLRSFPIQYSDCRLDKELKCDLNIQLG